jgi:hypothetical protein
LFIVILLAGVLLISFNLWFPAAAKWYVAHKSGFQLQIGHSKCALYRGLIDFNAVEIKNPEGKFFQDDCLKFNRLMLKANLLSMMAPEMVIEEIVIDVDRIVCDKNNQDDINVLEFGKAFMISEAKYLQLNKKRGKSVKDKKSDAKESLVKPESEKSESEKADDSSSKFFTICDDGHFVARKVMIHIDTFKLHNVTMAGEDKTIPINETWTLTDVKSKKEVIESVITHLQKYGIGIIMQNIFETVSNLPGIKSVNHVVEKVGRWGRGIFKSMAKAMTKMLPSKSAPETNTASNKPEPKKTAEPNNAAVGVPHN